MRTRLDDRRPSVGFDFFYLTNGGNFNQYTASFSVFNDIFPNGLRPAEIFIDARKIGSDETAIMRDAAVLASLALQNGCSLETLRTAVTRRENGQDPASPIGAALDALAEEVVSLADELESLKEETCND